MRKVTKGNRKPDTIDYDNISPMLRRIHNNANPLTNKIYPYVYGALDVRTRLSNLYHDKCAYCESKDPEFEIEHYRPKASVEKEIHPGYYWLCYEWTNLIPSCHNCNKPKYKGTKFPIAGNRAFAPIINVGGFDFASHNFLSQRLQEELPSLLHPEEPNFDPFKYFEFDESGQIQPKPRKGTRNYRRAKATITTVGLDRDQLYLNERKVSLNNITKAIASMNLKYFKDYFEFNERVASSNLKDKYFTLLGKIHNGKNERHEFSFFWTYIYIDLNKIIDLSIKKFNQRQKFRDLTTEFKLTHP